SLLNGMMHVPYMLQLAHGWPSLAVKVNLVAVIVLVPTILWVTPRYGAIGASVVWVALNAGYVLIGMHFMFQRLLNEEKWKWYRRDVLWPLGAAAGIAASSCLLKPNVDYMPTQLGWLMGVGVLTLLGTLAVSDQLKSRVIHGVISVCRR